MRTATLVLVSACALAACNPSAPSAPGGSSIFPELNATAYRAEAVLSGPDGETVPVVIVRSGDNMRMEVNAPQGQSTIIHNAQTNESFILAAMPGGPVTALRAEGMDEFDDPAEDWRGELEGAERLGPCSAAGESGVEWTKTTEADGTDTVCVTQDGIILKATDDGRTVWETTRVQRGPQGAENFTLPAGVQVMDLGNLGPAMGEAVRRAAGE